MSHTGFLITRLALTGSDVENAELSFTTGLNVITGPSDTGKTFVFQCIDFMFGAVTPPKAIPEIDGYDTVWLDIQSHQTKEKYSLKRSLKGGAFLLITEDGKERKLGGKHKADDPETVSQFLLWLTGIQEARIRTNEKGKTRSFSFRDMSHMAVISEETIIKTGSPVLSEQYTKATVEKSAFSFLLSGVDDSSVVETPDKKVVKTRFEAKEEVVEELIVKAQQKIEEMPVKGDLCTLNDQVGRLSHTIQGLTEFLNKTKESATSLENVRRAAWAKLKKVESRLGVLAELKSRFRLLREQYQTDICRLQAISETGKRLGEVKLNFCPVCGASSDAQDQDHQECHVDPLVVSESCTTEVSRIQRLIADLESTQGDIAAEIIELQSLQAQNQEDFKDASVKIQDSLNPRINDAISQMSELQGQREQICHVISHVDQLNEYEGLLSALRSESSKKPEKMVFADLDARHGEIFAKAVEERLKSWCYPDLDRVIFDSKECDIVISGRSRSSHGKGVRAITHAAFTLSLLKYCLGNGRPHSGVVAIDSPLVVYKQPDAGEEDFAGDVKEAFFRDLSESYQTAQVIIIENESPPEDLASSGAANVIHFTGTSQGRCGFIPLANSTDEEVAG